VEQLQGRVNLSFSTDNLCGAFCTFFLVSRWVRRVRERWNRWSSCRAGSIPAF
jgi:hypothetical protein